MADDLVLKGQGNVDVQVGGPGNNWSYLSGCAALGGPTVPQGGSEYRWCQDPNSAAGFAVSSEIDMAPDPITVDLTTKLGKVDYLAGLNCRFGIRARFAKCAPRQDPTNYDPIMLTYCKAKMTEHSYDDLVVTDPANNDEIVVTAPLYVPPLGEYRVRRISPTRVGTAATLGDMIINDIEYCDQVRCSGYCGDASDGCSKIYGVTNADTAPYAAPNLVIGTKDQDTGVITWVTYPILGANGNIHNVECAGNRIVVASNTDSAIYYNDEGGDQDEWVKVLLGNAPSAYHNALFFRTASEGYVACANGYIYKTTDGGVTWTAVMSGGLTANAVTCVWAYDKDLVYAGGLNGFLAKSTDGGATWDDITQTGVFAGTVLKVIVPPGRPGELYVGGNTGKIYRSMTGGTSLAALSFNGDGIGSIDDLDFCGPCGSDVLWILHNDAGPRGRILRDLSGGAGGRDVEEVMDYLDVIPTGVDLNAMACCDVNQAIAAGALYGGYPVVIKSG